MHFNATTILSVSVICLLQTLWNEARKNFASIMRREVQSAKSAFVAFTLGFCKAIPSPSCSRKQSASQRSFQTAETLLWHCRPLLRTVIVSIDLDTRRDLVEALPDIVPLRF